MRMRQTGGAFGCGERELRWLRMAAAQEMPAPVGGLALGDGRTVSGPACRRCVDSPRCLCRRLSPARSSGCRCARGAGRAVHRRTAGDFASRRYGGVDGLGRQIIRLVYLSETARHDSPGGCRDSPSRTSIRKSAPSSNLSKAYTGPLKRSRLSSRGRFRTALESMQEINACLVAAALKSGR